MDLPLPEFVRAWLSQYGLTFVESIDKDLAPSPKGSYPCIVAEPDRDSLEFFVAMVSPDGDFERLSSLKVYRDRNGEWKADDRRGNIAVYTNPDYRRHGLAKALWMAAIAQLGPIKHSENQTPEGEALAGSLPDSQAVVGPVSYETSVVSSLIADNYIFSASAKDIYEQYYPDIPEAAFVAAMNTDPTVDYGFGYSSIRELSDTPVGSFTKKLLQWYSKGLLRKAGHLNLYLPDRDEDIVKVLEYYNSVRPKLPPEYRDINKFKTPADLIEFIDKTLPSIQEESVKKDITTVYEDSEWVVLVPGSWTASCFYGEGSDWCTARREDSNYYNQYSREGTLYICLNKKNRSHSYQLFIPDKLFHHSVELRDWRNAPVSEFDMTRDGNSSLVVILRDKGLLPQKVYEYFIDTSLRSTDVAFIARRSEVGAQDKDLLGRFLMTGYYVDFSPETSPDYGPYGVIAVVLPRGENPPVYSISGLREIISKDAEVTGSVLGELTVNPAALLHHLRYLKTQAEAGDAEFVLVLTPDGLPSLEDDSLIPVLLSAVSKVESNMFSSISTLTDVPGLKWGSDPYTALVYGSDTATLEQLESVTKFLRKLS